MEQIELKAESRALKGRQVKKIREDGYVPAILYGSQVKATPIQVESKSLHKALAKAGGNTLISLQVGSKKPVLTLAREIQRDVLRHDVLHVDFLQVVMTEKITAEVPLILTGKAPAVEEKGGVLVHGLNTIEVQCLPADLPPSFRVELSTLTDFNDLVTVADLEVPAGVAILADPESVIARIEPPRMIEEEEEAAVEAGEIPEEPELVGRREGAGVPEGEQDREETEE